MQPWVGGVLCESTWHHMLQSDSMVSRGAAPPRPRSRKVLLPLPTSRLKQVRAWLLPSVCQDPWALGTLDICSKPEGP